MAEIRRAKLLITEVGQPVERPGKEGRKYTILGFTATQDGEARTYKTFYKSLIPLVVKGQTIEADIEDQQSTFQGLPQTEHIVVQIYQEGQPVAEKKSGGPGQGRAWGKSPEEARLERESIEGQVALKELGEYIRTGVAIPPDLVNLYQTALKTLVGRLVNGKPPKVETAIEQKPPQPDAPAMMPKTALTAGDRAAIIERQKTLGLSNADVKLALAQHPGKTKAEIISALEGFADSRDVRELL